MNAGLGVDAQDQLAPSAGDIANVMLSGLEAGLQSVDVSGDPIEALKALAEALIEYAPYRCPGHWSYTRITGEKESPSLVLLLPIPPPPLTAPTSVAVQASLHCATAPAAALTLRHRRGPPPYVRGEGRQPPTVRVREA